MNSAKKQIIKQTFPKAILYLTVFFLSFLSFTSCRHVADIYTPSEGDTTAKAVTTVVGKPFFPLGFYHVSWDSTAEQRMKDLRSIAAAGFNVIHASIKSLDDLNEYGKFLDEAERLGVYVISEFGVDPVATVNKFKNKPAVLGWNIGDDASSHDKANKLLQIHYQIKAADPNHLTYISVASKLDIYRIKKAYADYAHVADIIGGQSYPVGLPIPFKNVYDVFNIACSEANKHNHPVIANLQTFRWADTSWKGIKNFDSRRWPTAVEVYNMTYQALIAGVRGIIFYTYYDTENRIIEHPSIWNEVKSLVPEIKQLSPILLNGKLTKIDTKVLNVFAGIWKYQNQMIIVVLNTSSSSIRDVAIALPPQRTTEVKAMFPGRPSGMVVSSDKLSGSIKPKDVHIYSFKLAN